MTITQTRLDDVVAEVTAVAAAHADQVDTDGAYPVDAVEALRTSGLLGLVISEDSGGMGAGPAEFIEVVGSIAAACGSTAMIYLMHVAAAVTVASAPPVAMPDLLSRMASGEVLGTLAFSEKGSRSHFWAPVSESVADGDDLRFTAYKSWVTSAAHADVYVMSSRSAVDPKTVDLYAIPAGTPGLEVAGPWIALGLRGNEASPMSVAVTIPSGYRIGEAGSGFGTMMATVLPWFNLGNSAVSLGLSRAAVDAATTHVTGARLEHLDQALSALPTIRAQVAKMSIALAAQGAYLAQAAARVASPAADTGLFVLGVKASTNDAALTITESAMRVCGGAAFSKHLPIERAFRDARAGSVMAPTADVLYDFYGKALTGLPLF
ncbi:MAG: acyl-CoA/acyl-ACP dehydrogenase [Cryobacterium sp.]|uniref:Rv1679 family acyl-CoA dehydrogenase n=1 Tax=unclassified Cryobacterium TaxID=2649013 RepID=UPI0018CB9734|nr:MULTISPECIES: acyl-CoA dehydrogenase family protein [unclassified Cryobacterium]MCY7405038.1 acyl-CoA/acyl-ACP dehydrogenase [Cryobacterium sp.]MEC5153033.1 alkylation response protein AidB-like acyl-CoA dehydrogenase [Cryobacterium sp. CAN_C3]